MRQLEDLVSSFQEQRQIDASEGECPRRMRRLEDLTLAYQQRQEGTAKVIKPTSVSVLETSKEVAPTYTRAELLTSYQAVEKENLSSAPLGHTRRVSSKSTSRGASQPLHVSMPVGVDADTGTVVRANKAAEAVSTAPGSPRVFSDGRSSSDASTPREEDPH